MKGILLAVVCLSSAAFAEEPAKAEAKPAARTKAFVGMAAGDLKWTAMPDSKSPVALLWGNPKKGASGAFAKIPAGEKHPLHTHTANIKAVVVSGTWLAGADEASAKEYGAGSYFYVPGGWQHYSACKDGADCVLYMDTSAPFDMKPAEAAAAPAAK